MRLSFREASVILLILGFGLCCSCEQHHVGELPPASDPADGKQAEPAHGVSPAASGTPVDFFPEKKP